jgi:hypothetical protein
MYLKYTHLDFCKNAVCCKSYVEYIEHQEYLKTKKHLKKPFIMKQKQQQGTSTEAAAVTHS